jgi:hypothetical protein
MNKKVAKAIKKLKTFKINILSKDSELDIRCTSVKRKDGLIIVVPADSKREFWIPISSIYRAVITKD